MNTDLIKHIENQIINKQNPNFKYLNNKTLSGGCINSCFEFSSKDTSYFLKFNSADKYPNMFETEAEGLNLLSQTSCINIPKVIEVGRFENISYIILEFIKSERKKSNYWEDFGQKLASLHKNTNSTFGLNFDNYIGSLTQINTTKDSWTDFFIENRLEKLVALCYDYQLIDYQTKKQFNQFYSRLEKLIPKENPSLIHGDLWSGNVIVNQKGEVCLVDPSVYYAHREIELAFTFLFGSHPEEFYKTYNENFPLEKDWRKRIDLFNLYPLLVHLKLFGSSYFSQLKNNLTKYL